MFALYVVRCFFNNPVVLKYRLYTEVEGAMKKHSPETEVYNMLLLWGIFTKQRWFAALETHSN